MNQSSPALAQPRSRSNPRASLVGAAETSRTELTFRGNLAGTRHAWLRLTPAYSVRLVSGLLTASGAADPPFLDPFCGTGTTLLACTEHALDCDTVDINPFLIWLARSKVGNYTNSQLVEAQRGVARMRRAALREHGRAAWTPPIHRIERWWGPATLAALSRSFASFDQLSQNCSRPAANLLRLAFCQALIERSRAHFGHQSMSFAPGSAHASEDDLVPESPSAADDVASSLGEALERLVATARLGLPATRRRLFLADSRRLDEKLPASHYGCVITSPPYANRMSYIRELRPYMYWLRYLEDRTHAGVLDWRAIGGTWGVATSNLGSWSPEPALDLGADLEARLGAIAERSVLLSSYVRKYFHDMSAHLASLGRVLRPGGRALFVVGNSKFYDVVVPVEQVLARQFEAAGFSGVSIETLRKRSSKKELYEFLISARRR